MSVEGVLTVTGTPTTTTRWIEGTSTVTVTDGRLTIRSGAGASNNKICFVEISTVVVQGSEVQGSDGVTAMNAEAKNARILG